MKRITFLRTAGWLSIILGIAHFLCMPWLKDAFRFFGIDKFMSGLAAHCASLPYFITIIIACIFVLAGTYALSAEGDVYRLPLIWIGVFTIAAAFLLRAMIGLGVMVHNGSYPITSISWAVISAVIGLFYLVGGINKLMSEK